MVLPGGEYVGVALPGGEYVGAGPGFSAVAGHVSLASRQLAELLQSETEREQVGTHTEAKLQQEAAQEVVLGLIGKRVNEGLTTHTQCEEMS